eukprot:5286266-Lingulodinium_polyedra.AAC.1
MVPRVGGRMEDARWRRYSPALGSRPLRQPWPTSCTVPPSGVVPARCHARPGHARLAERLV